MGVECAQQDDACVCGKLCKHQGGEGSCRGSDGSSEEGVGDPPKGSVNILRGSELCAVFLEESEYMNIQGRKIFVLVETFMTLNDRKLILIKFRKNKIGTSLAFQ